MASLPIASFSVAAPRQISRGMPAISSASSVSFFTHGKTFPAFKLHTQRSRISCAAKAETVDKVIKIVQKQLALPEATAITGETKFATLGADSLDTVEIVMGLEEAFGISVEEESAQSISTVQDAADLIDKLTGN